MKKIIIYSALLLIVVLIIAAFILFFYKKTELELKPEIEMEYLGRKIDTTGWITIKPSPMNLGMSISKDNFNVKPEDEIEIKIHAWIFQPVKGENKNFIFEIYKEFNKIGEFNFPIEHEGTYYEGIFKLIIKAPSIEGEYNYSIIWMKDMKAVFKIIVKK